MARSPPTRAVALCERVCGADHWTFASVLTDAGNAFCDNDAVIAEGLYRSAIARAERQMTNSTVLPANSFISVEMYLRAVSAYADLLEKLEWNGKSRAAEAKTIRTNAQSKVASVAQRMRLAPLLQHLLLFITRFTG